MSSFPKALFVSHGGGPLPLLGDQSHGELVACLTQIASDIPKPSAIVVVSAHWEEAIPTLTAGAAPPLVYDYYGFPEEAYGIQYSCAGHPVLARRIQNLMTDVGIASALDDRRGFDHGVFVPLKILYPNADIPCVQLSLVDSLDPALHINMGSALSGLSLENILLVGSGFTFHNMSAFFRSDLPGAQHWNRAFEDWLRATCGDTQRSEEDRRTALINWAEAPGALFCQPREEHLLPLHVCYGAAQSASRAHFEINILGKKASIILW